MNKETAIIMAMKSIVSKNTEAKVGAAIRSVSRTSAAGARNVLDILTAKPVALPRDANDDIFARMDLLSLNQGIESALPDMESRVIVIAGCGRGEGSTAIGTALSAVASEMLDHPTLFIDIFATAAPAGVMRKANMASLTDVARGSAVISNAITPALEGGALYDYAFLSTEGGAGDILAHHEHIKRVLSMLRNQYRLILLPASDILADPLGLSLSSLADGVVLVVEAERTRAHAARQALELLGRKGARVIGLAFNKRRYYIPGWLYRWL